MNCAEKIVKEDLEQICSAAYIPWQDLEGKTILVTGATGLIGTNIVEALCWADEKFALHSRVLALVRDRNKAEKTFSEQLRTAKALELVVGTVEQLPEMEDSVDYIIHAANPTASKFFQDHPVETLEIAISGTKNILELARRKESLGVVFLSSMEVYGCPPKGTTIQEKDVAGFQPSVTRNCYPLSKLTCESLCCAYAAEYNVPAKIVRLTQTFGPGVQYQDGRVFAEFMRCAVEKRDIVLKTRGLTERSYLYTADAVTAILTVLLCGENGESYTAANADTYCSIYQMAELVAKELANNCISVIAAEADNGAAFGYADTLYMNLDTSKLESLGWRATRSLPEMFQRMTSSAVK